MKIRTRIFLLDLYLAWLVFLRWTATGLGIGMGLFFAMLLVGFIKRVGG